MGSTPKNPLYIGSHGTGDDGYAKNGPVLPGTPFAVTNNQKAIDAWYASKNMFVPEDKVQGTHYYLSKGLTPPPSAYEMDKRIRNPKSPTSGPSKSVAEAGADYSAKGVTAKSAYETVYGAPTPAAPTLAPQAQNYQSIAAQVQGLKPTAAIQALSDSLKTAKTQEEKMAILQEQSRQAQYQSAENTQSRNAELSYYTGPDPKAKAPNLNPDPTLPLTYNKQTGFFENEPASKKYVPTIQPQVNQPITGGFAPPTSSQEQAIQATPVAQPIAQPVAQSNEQQTLSTSPVQNAGIAGEYSDALNSTVNAQAGSAMNQAALERQMVPTLAADLQNKYNTVGNSVFGIQSSFFNPSEQMQNMYGQSQIGMAGQLSNRAVGAAAQNANIASGGLYGAINDRAMRDLSFGSGLNMQDTIHAQQSARAAAQARGLQFSPQGSNLEILNTYNLGATRLKERQAQANTAYGNASQAQQFGYQSLLNPVLAESQKAGLYNQLTMTGNAMGSLMPNMLQPESQLYQNMYNQKAQTENVKIAQGGIANSEAQATARTLGAAQISADAYAKAMAAAGGTTGGSTGNPAMGDYSIGGGTTGGYQLPGTGGGSTLIPYSNGFGSYLMPGITGGTGGGVMTVGTGKSNPNQGIQGGGMTVTVGGGQGGNKNQYVNNNPALGLLNDTSNINSPNYKPFGYQSAGNKTAGPINPKATISSPSYNIPTLSPNSYGLTSGIMGGQNQYFDLNF